MSEVTQPSATSGTPGETPTPVPAASEPTPPAVPAGYVPQTELDKERERSRGFQSEADRVKEELKKLQAPAAPTSAAPDPASTVDPTALVNDAVAKVFRAGEIRDAAAALKTEFPDVEKFDPSIFSGERIASFDSADALRIFVKDLDSRLGQFRGGDQQAADEAARQAAAAAASGAPGPGGQQPAPAGDPTPEQFAAMTIAEQDALEIANPGVFDRVMAKAQAAVA